MKVGKVTISSVLNKNPDADNIYIGRGISDGQESPLAHREWVSRNIDHDKMCDMYEEYIASQMTSKTPVREEIKRIVLLVLAGTNVNLMAYGLIRHDRCVTQTIERIVNRLVAKQVAKNS